MVKSFLPEDFVTTTLRGRFLFLRRVSGGSYPLGLQQDASALWSVEYIFRRMEECCRYIGTHLGLCNALLHAIPASLTSELAMYSVATLRRFRSSRGPEVPVVPRATRRLLT